MSVEVLHTPVLVVGAGPVGLVLACELSAHGVPCLLAERNEATTQFPKMDITNGRSMELLRRLDLAEAVRSAGVAPEHRFDVVFATGLGDDGSELGRWSLPSVDEARDIIRFVNDGSQPSEPAQRCSQAIFEALVMARCEADPLIDVRTGWRAESLVEADEQVEVVFDTAEAPASVHADWVVGCDGASSVVRDAVGIGLEGVTGVADLAMVHFRSHDLGRLHRYGRFWHIYFTNGGVIISQDEGDTWTMHQLVAPDFDWATTDPVAFVHETLGAPVEIDEVLLTSRWRPNLLVAERYRSGRVFLAGDAAHQVIPTGGYGMNTGVGDAVDIGWKLAAVVHGWGGPVLLDSYEVERLPVAQRNRDASGRHAFALMDWRAKEGTRAEPGENESFGIELDYRFPDSPVIVADDSVEPPWDPLVVTPSTRPGHRAPGVFLPDGSALADRFLVDGLSLLDFSGEGRGKAVAQVADDLGVPIALVEVDDPLVALVYERPLVLVRPDGFVAWRGDALPDHRAVVEELIDRVRGMEKESPR